MFHRYCELPDLVQTQVLSNLNLRQRLQAESVCKDFQKRLRHPGLWKGVTTVRLSGRHLSTNRPELGCVLELPEQALFERDEQRWYMENDQLRRRVDRVVVGLIRFLAGKEVRLESLELERLQCMGWRGIDALSVALTETGTKLRRLVLSGTITRVQDKKTGAPIKSHLERVTKGLLDSQVKAGRLEQLAVGSLLRTRGALFGTLSLNDLLGPKSPSNYSGIRFLSIESVGKNTNMWLSGKWPDLEMLSMTPSLQKVFDRNDVVWVSIAAEASAEVALIKPKLRLEDRLGRLVWVKPGVDVPEPKGRFRLPPLNIG